MARSRSAGVSGVAVSFMVAGGYLVYAGINDVPLLDGFRSLLRGERPESRTPDQAPYDGPQITSEQGYNIGQNALQIAVGAVTGLPAGPVPREQTVVVPGTQIRVHRSIAPKVTTMVGKARAEGVDLDGYGWRDTQQQRELREQHGYTSDDQPSGSGGRLPVARPGESMHERGLAIDFTQNGRQLNRVLTGFTWLRRHAASYGLHNLPSEPWHWSTNGR